MSSTLDTSKPHRLTHRRAVAAGADRPVADDRERIAAEPLVVYVQPHRRDRHTVNHDRNDAAFCASCGAPLQATTPYECGGNGDVVTEV